MKIQIESRRSNKILFEGEYESTRHAVEAAVSSGASLHDASLRDANLRDANLCRADLRGASLRGTDLHGADLRDANLRDANLRDANLCRADLRGASLRDADLRGASLHGSNLSGTDLHGANLRDANLSGASLHGSNLSGTDLHGANLSCANLYGANLYGANLCGVPKIENIHQSVYTATSQAGALDMEEVHICETTHCRAGWVVRLAGEAGAAMEFCLGWSAAAALIYIKSDPKLRKIPDFHASNEDALADMKRLAELEGA